MKKEYEKNYYVVKAEDVEKSLTTTGSPKPSCCRECTMAVSGATNVS